MNAFPPPGAARRIATCSLLALASVAAGPARAGFSPFGDGALGASGKIGGGASQSAYDSRPLPPSLGDHASVGFGLQDPVKAVGSASVLATAGYGQLGGGSSAAASWDPLIDGTTGGGGWTAGTGYTGSPSGLRMTYFGDVLTVNAAGHAGQSGVAHATLTLSSLLSTSLPNIVIGDAASEQASVGFSVDVVTGATDSWGESGLAHATSHLQATGGLSIANGAGYQGGENLNQMQVLNMGHLVYDGTIQPRYVLELDIPIVFGQSFSLGAQLQSGAAATVGVPALSPDDPAYAFTRYAFAQANISLAWGGISSVDVTSPPDLVAPTVTTLNDFSVVSASGTDYLHAISPVPEPGSGWLLAAGCGWLGWRRRTRADRHPGVDWRPPPEPCATSDAQDARS